MHGSEVVILDLENLEIVDRKIPDLEKSGIFMFTEASEKGECTMNSSVLECLSDCD